MKILITGGTGLIGRELIKLLISKGHNVNYLSTTKSKIAHSSNCNGFYWNPKKNVMDLSSMEGVEVIVHLAGAPIAKCWTKSYKKEIVESRTDSIEMLYRLVKDSPNQIKQVVSASGIAVYPESFSKVYDETCTETDNSFLSTVVTKWEESVDRFKPLGIKVCKLRTGMVLSNRGGALPEFAKPIRMGIGAAMNSGKQIQPWIHINDIVAMYYFMIDNQMEGIYNAVSPNHVTNQELTKIIARTLNRPLFLPHFPKPVINLLLGEMSYLLFSSKNLSAQKIIDSGFQFQFTEINEAIADLYK